MTVFYFTATGNCLEVAKSFGDARLLSIPQVLNSEECEFCDDVIGVVFPVYFSDVPNVVKRFLYEVKLKADYTFAILTYGEARGVAVNRLKCLSRLVGLNFSYVNTVKMVDNYYPLYDVECQVKNLHRKQVDRKIQAIKTDIETRRLRAGNPDLLDWMLGVTILFKPDYTKHSARFYVDEARCTKCGMCARVCPSGDIVAKPGVMPRFKTKFCEACGACTHNCPQNAIRYRCERSKNRYRNHKISLQDIINANEEKQ